MIHCLGKRALQCFGTGQVLWLAASLSSCSDSSGEPPREDDTKELGGMGGEEPGPKATGGKNSASMGTGGATSGKSNSGGRGSLGMGGVESASGGSANHPPAGGTNSDTGGQGGAAQALELNSLEVTGGASVWPPFSPDIRRYAVRASDPVQALEVTVNADPDVDVFVAGNSVRVVGPTQLNATPGDEIDIALEGPGGAMDRYTLVYLPNDFPHLNVSILEEGASTDPIYLGLEFSGSAYAAKVDNNGVPYFYLRPENDVIDFKKHPDGRMSYADVVDDGTLILLDQDLDVIDRIHSIGYSRTDGHEFKILDNGNYVLLAVNKSTWDLSEFGGLSDQPVLDSIFQEMTPDRQVVFEWNTQAHMNYYESLALDRQPQDYAHLNSLDIGEDGDWLISSRFMSQVLKISRKTGEVIWRLGGIASDFEFANDPYDGFCGQHTASWVGENRILLFDNGKLFCAPGREERVTRAVEYLLDEEEMTATLVWSYTGVSAQAMGSAQRLGNGNTFLGWGTSRELLATEVDAQGNVVFEMSSESPDVYGYRAQRFPD